MDTGARQKNTDDLYENVDAMRGEITMEINNPNTTIIQPSEHTGSDCVKIRSSRAAVVCLVLLCVLLLTAVIVLCVTLTQERQQLISKNENLTNEREQLILKNTNLTNEREQLLLKNTNLTNEREQLLLKNTNLTNEREQLLLKNTNLTNEREQLRNELQICVGWTCYQSSFYYKSNETKNWTESRRDCTERGADLTIINNREEQDFVQNMSGATAVYIGLTDIDEEGRWKWVDGSALGSSFSSWANGEPDGGRSENCAVTVAKPLYEFANLVGWFDASCNKAYRWICEKRISQIKLP